MDKTYPVVVPAAGVGKRMQADRPKQYLLLHGKTILEHTLATLHAHPRIGQIVVVLHPDDQFFAHLPLAGAPWLTAVVGGQERADSVLAGLAAVQQQDWVLVHDAARPCISHDDISRLLTLAEGEIGGLLAAPVRDTMKRTDANGRVHATVERQHLWHALTPQFFPFAQLHQALSQALSEQVTITDEASAMEFAGHPVQLLQGDASNIKITHPRDMLLAAVFLNHEYQDTL